MPSLARREGVYIWVGGIRHTPILTKKELGQENYKNEKRSVPLLCTHIHRDTIDGQTCDRCGVCLYPPRESISMSDFIFWHSVWIALSFQVSLVEDDVVVPR